MRPHSFALLLSFAVGTANAQSYTYFSFDAPGSTLTVPAGINNCGQIVGGFDDAAGRHGFLRTGATYTVIEAPGATR